jgi:porin
MRYLALAVILVFATKVARADGLLADAFPGGLIPQNLMPDGLKLTGGLVGEAAGNPVGGRSQGGAYAQEIHFGADLDSSALGWDGGTLHVLITQRVGASLSKNDIGNLLTVQEIYGDGETVRITALAYEQKLFGGLLDVQGGRLNVQQDFASSPVYFGTALYCNFESNAICGEPIAAPLNDGGDIAYPASSWGARIKTYPAHNLYIEAGAYEVNPTLYLSRNGFKLGTDGATGVITVAETGVAVDAGGFAGNYRAGAYYDNSSGMGVDSLLSRVSVADAGALDTLSIAQHTGKSGGWLLADQTVQRDPANTHRGTVVFAAFEWGDRATALVNRYGQAGVVRYGTMAGRDLDTVAVGFIAASLNGALHGAEQQLLRQGVPSPLTSQEYALEVNYGYQATTWLNLRPGVQYVWHPAGTNELHNALVLALKTVVTF